MYLSDLMVPVAFYLAFKCWLLALTQHYSSLSNTVDNILLWTVLSYLKCLRFTTMWACTINLRLELEQTWPFQRQRVQSLPGAALASLWKTRSVKLEPLASVRKSQIKCYVVTMQYSVQVGFTYAAQV